MLMISEKERQSAFNLFFEVLSKSTVQKDRNTKFNIYEREAIKYYVIIDPDDHVAKVHELALGRYSQLFDVDKDVVAFDLGPCKIQLNFTKIWIRNTVCLFWML